VVEEPTRQHRIDVCLAEIAGQREFPAFSHHIQEVMRVIADDGASLRRLTDMVLRDFSLTLRVLRAANSVCYNRSGRPVVSVAHAVALLGTESIRDLAGSVALFEYYRKISPGLKELMLLSLLTANQTRSVSLLVKFPRPEEAYICGMFRNLGEVLIASYFPRRYAEVLANMNQVNVPEREACLQALHFTYEELGQAMTEQWQLPDMVGNCMNDSNAMRPGAADSEEGLLRAAVAFSHALTAAVYRREPEGASARMNLLVQDYYPALGLRQEDVAQLLERAIADTKSTFATLSTPLDVLRLRRQAEAALASVAAAPADEETTALAGLAHGEDLIEQLSRDVAAAIEAPEPDLHKVILMTLEAIYRGGPFDRVLFCLTDRDHTTVRGRLGLGQGIEAFREKFHAPISARGGLVGAALVRRQDLFIAGEGSYAQTEALKGVGAKSLGVFPITVDGVLGGCLYFDRLTEQPAPGPRTLELIARLRDLAAKAIAGRRASFSE